MKLLQKPTTRLLTLLPAAAAFALLGANMANAAYPDLILSDHPVAYYRLEELAGAGVAVDSSGSGFDATYSYDLDTNGVPDFPLLGLPGIATNSVLFDVYTDANSAQHRGYVSIPFQPALSPTTGDGQHGAAFSAECWVQAISQPAAHSIPLAMFGQYEAAAPYQNASGWNFYQSPGPGSYWIFNVKNGPFAEAVNIPIQLYRWYHLAATFDGSIFVFYVNGAAQVTSGPTATYLADHNFNGQIGAGDNTGFLPFNGGVDEVAFYTNSLSATQITNHFAAGLTSFVARSFPPMILQNPASATVNSGSQASFTAIVDGATPLAYQWLRGGQPITGATVNPYAFTASYPADNNSTFSIVVTNVYGSVTSAVATLTVQGILNLDHSAFSVTREAGAKSKAAFRVVASGSPPIRYQWYKVVGATTNVIGGATNDTLWLSGLQLSDDGSAYYAHVTNAFGITNSDPATLAVTPRAVIEPISGYGRFVLADDPVAYWRLDESSGSSVATDAVGSFDGAYQANAGVFTFGVPTGIPHETNVAINVSTGAVVTIPYALELNPVTGPWSFEAWIRPTTLDPGSFRTPFSSMWNSDFGNHIFGWNIYQHPDGYWTLNAYNGSAGGSFTSDFTHHPLDTNLWYHMVITDDLINLRYYVNNVLVVVLSRQGFGFIPNGINGDRALAGAATVLAQRSDNAFDPFTGDIDDAASYNYALSPQQIANHFLNNAKLTIAKQGTNVVLTWPVGTLQAASAIGGTYADQPAATSPYTNAISAAPKYYRVKVQ